MAYTTETNIKVRFSECDYYQHVNNAMYIVYANTGLADYLRSVWGDIKNLPFQIHMRHVEINFSGSATFDEELVVRTTVDKIGNTSLTFQTIITNKTTGAQITELKQTYVTLDLSGNKIPVPEGFKK